MTIQRLATVFLTTFALAPGAARASTFLVPNCQSDPRWKATAAPGEATVSPSVVEVGAYLGRDGVPPLVVEIALPQGAFIPGRGLPPLTTGRDPLLVPGYQVDRSVLQLELPILRPPASAEEEVSPASVAFAAPRTCVVDAPYVPPSSSGSGPTPPPGDASSATGDTSLPLGDTAPAGSTGDTATLLDYESVTCPYDRDDTPGMWRAWRVQDHPLDGTCTVTELQLARTTLDQIDLVQAPSIMGVWLPEGEALEEGDRVIFEIQGPAPTLATDWTGVPYQPHLRMAHPSCPGHEEETWPSSCFDVLDQDHIEGLELAAGPPTFLRINQPLDVVKGTPLRAEAVLLDAYANPSTHTTDPSRPIVLQSRTPDGRTSGTFDLTFNGTWREPFTVPWHATAAVTVDADVSASDLPDLTVIRSWTRTWRSEPPFRVSVGDLHFHPGVTASPDGTPARFLPSGTPGDHAAQTTRVDLSYRYVDEVMGLDFASASEHAIAPANYTLPPDPTFDAFRAGGVCDIGPIHPDIPDWWTHLQLTDADLDRPDFAIFPAFEWHAHQREPVNGVDVDNTRLHRVVVYRDVPQALDLPMLPGTAPNLPAQCLPLFMVASGYADASKIDDVVTIPHMSRNLRDNLDWDLQYDWSGEFANLLALLDPDPEVARDLIEQQSRLVEIYSARAANNTAFEGRWVDGSAPERWTVRYGLAQGAHVGFVGSSDNHSQRPGSNNDRRTGAATGSRQHEPGGLAFVLRDSSASLHDGVFDGLRARRTYATSGIRAWMDVRLIDPSQPLLPALSMGEAHSTSACELTLDVEVMVGADIQAVEVLDAEVQHTPGGVSTSWSRRAIGVSKLPDEVFTHSATLAHPGVAGEHVYYVRAKVGLPQSPPDELVWSSPIWITWDDPGLCP